MKFLHGGPTLGKTSAMGEVPTATCVHVGLGGCSEPPRCVSPAHPGRIPVARRGRVSRRLPPYWAAAASRSLDCEQLQRSAGPPPEEQDAALFPPPRQQLRCTLVCMRAFRRWLSYRLEVTPSRAGSHFWAVQASGLFSAFLPSSYPPLQANCGLRLRPADRLALCGAPRVCSCGRQRHQQAYRRCLLSQPPVTAAP